MQHLHTQLENHSVDRAKARSSVRVVASYRERCQTLRAMQPTHNGQTPVSECKLKNRHPTLMTDSASFSTPQAGDEDTGISRWRSSPLTTAPLGGYAHEKRWDGQQRQISEQICEAVKRKELTPRSGGEEPWAWWMHSPSDGRPWRQPPLRARSTYYTLINRRQWLKERSDALRDARQGIAK